MEQRYWLLILFSFATSIAAPLQKNNLVPFYPISRAQYDAILSMTAGQPVISEAKLISSGFQTLGNLKTVISSDISSGLQQLLDKTGLRHIDYKNTEHKVDGYPLCVIKTIDWNDEPDSKVDENLQRELNIDDDETKREENQYYEENNNRNVMNCIVVVKKPEEIDQQHMESQEDEVPQNKVSIKQKKRSRKPAYRSPYSYPTYAYPVYPFYDFPNLPDALYSEIKKTIPKSTPKRTKSYKHERRASTSTIHAESPKPNRDDKTTGRSNYGGYYPGSYGGYGAYPGYGNYYQQAYPYSAGYGGCYNPYGSSYYGGDFSRRDIDNDNGEDSEISSEVAGEVGGEIGDE